MKFKEIVAPSERIKQMVDYHLFSDQMRPVSEEILNALKLKERRLNQKVLAQDKDRPCLKGLLQVQPFWFQLVQLLISAA